jgi:hypothetical protein
MTQLAIMSKIARGGLMSLSVEEFESREYGSLPPDYAMDEGFFVENSVTRSVPTEGNEPVDIGTIAIKRR